jgi:hypothetical protein
MQASWVAARVRRIITGNPILGWLRSRFVH